MPKLLELRLYANRMTGSIPPEVGNAPRLETLRLENNFFEGTLVTEIGAVTTLTDLNVGFNDFNRKVSRYHVFITRSLADLPWKISPVRVHIHPRYSRFQRK